MKIKLICGLIIFFFVFTSATLIYAKEAETTEVKAGESDIEGTEVDKDTAQPIGESTAAEQTAEEPEASEEEAPTLEDLIESALAFRLSYHITDTSGYKGRVGEYQVLDAGPGGELRLSTHLDRNFFDFFARFYDEKDLEISTEIDLGRIFELEINWDRLPHYLDHDPLSNFNVPGSFTHTDYDIGRNYFIRRSEFETKMELRTPEFPQAKFKFEYRSLKKEGHRQAMTLDQNCFTHACHIVSKTQAIRWHLEEFKPGIELKAGPATLDYTHLIRRFYQRDTPLTFASNNFVMMGTYPYAQVPDSETHADKVKLHLDLPLNTSVFTNWVGGKTTNRNTPLDRSFDAFNFRSTTRFSKYLTLSGYFKNRSVRKELAGNLDRDEDIVGLKAVSRPWNWLTLKGEIRHKHMDRDFTDQFLSSPTFAGFASTTTDIFTLAAYMRPLKTVDCRLEFTFEDTENPFATVHSDPLRPTMGSQPTDRNRFSAQTTWSPTDFLSLSSSLILEDRENNDLGWDEDDVSLSLSSWWAVSQRLSLTAGYTYEDTDIKQDIVYGTDPTYIVMGYNTPYNQNAHTIFLGCDYILTPQITLHGSGAWCNAKAEFDSSNAYPDIGTYSSSDIDKFDLSVGLDYAVRKNCNLFINYTYEDYGDDGASYLNGSAHIINFGIGYEF